MPSYYNHHDGNLFPGLVAKSEDIHQIQINVDEAIRSLIEDQYDHTAFILGSRENAFLISPAPKRLGRYIDNMNLVNESNEIWLDIDSFGYKQAIKTSKTSLYSTIVKLKNNYSESQDVSFELWSEDNKIAKQTVTVPNNTTGEFEVVFNLEHFSTQHGRQGEELEKPDAQFVAHPNIEQHIEQEYERANNPDNQSLGSTVLYFVVKAIHKATEIVTPSANTPTTIDDNTFMICADSQGNYGQLLERTADDGRNYEATNYDLFFKNIYSNAPTYLCSGGVAVVHGGPVLCNDTHVTVDGASNAGNTKSYITMDAWGQLNSYTSHAYWGDESEAIFDEFPNGDLIIAIIYTYNGDIKPPKIIQDDNLIEDLIKKDKFGEHEFGMPIRQRSHHERLRRLEKEMAYHRDVTIPSRLKYNLTGDDIPATNSDADDGAQKVSQLNATGTANAQLTDAQKSIDWSKYFISTDKYGNFVVKSIDAETEQIPVTLKETASLEGKTYEKLAQTIVSSTNVDIDRDDGTAQLSEHQVTTTKTENKTKETLSKYGVGTSAKEAKLTEFNPWDDKAGNRPETADIKPTTHIFTTKKGVNGVNVRSSEYPAMTLYLKEKLTLKELAVPVVKFKNVDKVQFHLWERQGPNNKHNTVWLEKLVDSSPKFSLKNAKTKDGYQILDEPFVWEWKNGLKLRKHQYIVLIQIFPKSGDGSVYVKTYKPKDSTDFLIRYHGSADCAHFRLKTRYREVWYSPSNQNESSKYKAKIKAYVNEYYKEGRIESGEVVWENKEPISSITPSMNAHIPDGCSIELQANVGNGWKTLQNNQPTNIVGGTSSFKWRAILKGNGTKTPQIYYDDNKKYAINFTIAHQKPKVGSTTAGDGYADKNVLTTQTFYPGDILRKYIGDENLNTCNKFSNYEWIRIFAEASGNTSALIDIAASDTRLSLTEIQNSNSYSSATTTADSCAPKANEFDLFTLYYADLTLDDFTQESVDYSNYDNNIEYDEHNLRFKIDTDRAYNDDDVALITIQDAEVLVKERDESKITEQDGVITDNNDVITLKPQENYLTVVFKDFTSDEENSYKDDNSFIWKYTLPGDSTIDLSNYSALKIGYNYMKEGDISADTSLSGVALYISSAVEEEAPSHNYDGKKIFDGKTIERYEDIAPKELTTAELEEYKNKILEVTREQNGVTYTEYYYYIPDENGIWKRHQYHNINSFTIYQLPEFNSEYFLSNSDKNNQYITISIDNNNDNFKYVKEIGLIALSDTTNPEASLNTTGTSSLQILNIKGIIQGYNTIYSAEKSLNPANDSYVGDNKHYQTALFRDASDQVSSLTRVFYNNLDAKGEMIGYINNGSYTTDANNFAVQFVADTYLPKDAMTIKLCEEENGVKPIFSLNLPTLNHIYYDPKLHDSTLFNSSNDSNTLKKWDSNSTSISTANSYSVSSSVQYPTEWPDGKKKSDYVGTDNEIVYKISIEPNTTVLNVNDDTLTWNIFKQKRLTYNKKTKKETFGNKEYIGKIYNSAGREQTHRPALQMIVGSTVYKSTESGSGTNITSDMVKGDGFGVKFDYAPGRYTVRVGFQGFATIVDNSSDTEHHNKLVTYRSAENQFTVDMFWKISNTVNFAQIYKKINEDKTIKSISIHTTEKFQDYMNTIRGTQKTETTPSPYMHFFIKNMVLHEAEHIPLFHPNMRMKIYSKAADGSDTDVEAVNVRKVGAVIEYK